MNKEVSYIISTRNRAKGLKKCLQEINKISYHSWELILVDNGSSDETADIINDFIQKTNLYVIYVREDKPGASNGRNAGIAASCGRILLFSDDDCYPAFDFVEKTVSAFENEPQLGYISGRIELFDPTDAPTTIKTSLIPQYFKAGTYIGSGKVVGANMAFRREVINEIGIFDPLLGAGTSLPSAEEQELAIRASIAGYEGKYCPEILTYHHHGRKASDVAKLHQGYNIGRGGLNTKLLFSAKTFKFGLLGWASLVKRVLMKQSTLKDEFTGAYRYLKCR